ncbi:hypothetical protein ACHFJ0_00505 [Paracoccus sp. NGMCC 1.201697]|uniref:Uncharacterized protein n=1 Tax=Paracoccus broussonetiae subsp. drimophilus TaxID=3373869 RepID=A0ABW7LFU0_9RHOB
MKSYAIRDRAGIAEAIAEYFGWDKAAFVRAALQTHYGHEAANDLLRPMFGPKSLTPRETDGVIYGIAAYAMERHLHYVEANMRKSKVPESWMNFQEDAIPPLAQAVRRAFMEVMQGN